MRAILDASVGLKWLIVNEIDADRAAHLHRELFAGIHEFLAPGIFAIEIANALTRSERKKDIPVGMAAVLYSGLIPSMPILHSGTPMMSRAIGISSATRTSIYDCLYVALAEREGVPLITADQKLLTNLGADFPIFIDLAQLPQ